MRTLPPLRDRILSQLAMAPRNRMTYHSLARRVYPPCLFTMSWNSANHGGPPGCYMSLSSMIRKLPEVNDFDIDGTRTVFLNRQAG